MIHVYTSLILVKWNDVANNILKYMPEFAACHLRDPLLHFPPGTVHCSAPALPIYGHRDTICPTPTPWGQHGPPHDPTFPPIPVPCNGVQLARVASRRIAREGYNHRNPTPVFPTPEHILFGERAPLSWRIRKGNHSSSLMRTESQATQWLD